MTKIKSAVDIASEATSAVGWTDSYSAMFHAEKVIKEDRLSHKEAIVGALEGIKRPEVHDELCDGYCESWGCTLPDKRASNKTLDQAIAIVNSIYKDSE